MRALHHAGLMPQVEFMHLSSYRDATVSSGHVEILKDVESDVRDRDVVLIDDILESGRTLAFAKDLLTARGARVMTCCLLEKPGKSAVSIKADFVGFSCPDLFVVGYVDWSTTNHRNRPGSRPDQLERPAVAPLPPAPDRASAPRVPMWSASPSTSLWAKRWDSTITSAAGTPPRPSARSGRPRRRPARGFGFRPL